MKLGVRIVHVSKKQFRRSVHRDACVCEVVVCSIQQDYHIVFDCPVRHVIQRPDPCLRITVIVAERQPYRRCCGTTPCLIGGQRHLVVVRRVGEKLPHAASTGATAELKPARTNAKLARVPIPPTVPRCRLEVKLQTSHLKRPLEAAVVCRCLNDGCCTVHPRRRRPGGISPTNIFRTIIASPAQACMVQGSVGKSRYGAYGCTDGD